MQLDFEGIGFKLRIPIFNRDGNDLRLRTAVIPLDDSLHNIEITAMQLTDEEKVMITAFQDDIEPSNIEVQDSRKTINAIFHSVEDKGDTEYDLCISINDMTLEQRVQVHYTFNAGSTIATFYGVEIIPLQGNEPIDDVVSDVEDATREVVEEVETTDSDSEAEDDEFSDSEESTEEEILSVDEENAVQRATRLLWIANKELEEASAKILSQETKIAMLEEKLEKAGDVEELQEKVDNLEEEIRNWRHRSIRATARISSLESELAEAKKNPPLPPISQLEKHLNDIVEYMESTATSAGISLENIYVRTSIKDGKRHVDVYGEIRFATGRSSLKTGCNIKASLYDASGKIEIESQHYVSNSFKGFDTFNIGWKGGTDESWLSESKIRIFVV